MLTSVLDRRPAVPGHPVRWAVPDAILVLLGAQLVGFLWAGAAIVGVYGGESIPAELPIAVGLLANVGLWLGYGLGSVLVTRLRGKGFVADLGGSVRALDVPIGLGIGVLLQLAVLPLLYWPLLRFVDGDPSDAARELLARVDGRLDWFLLCVSVVVMAPLVEELFYRGLFLRALDKRFGVLAAVVVSSAVFAVVHRQLLPLPGLFVFGAAAAIAAISTGRLGMSWSMHVGFNATTLVLLGLVE